MPTSDMVLYDEEFLKIKDAIGRLRQDANAKTVLLIDRNGQEIAVAGETENLDTTAVASLAAGNVAATDGLAKLIGEPDFASLTHEGTKVSLNITLIGKRVVLLVMFDDRSSLGLVRLRVKRSGEELSRIFDQILAKAEAEREKGGGIDSPFAEITDDDIDALFND
jgi:predicted regulator of Ras-like GTPase activity (Roadblock/LC7/MglB family)